MTAELTGALLSGRYRLGPVIGSGGMADVHRAYDQNLRREVAVKILKPALLADTSAMARFTSEAQTQALLNVPGVPAVHDIGTSHGTPFFVMELLAGRDLKTALRAQGPLPVATALRVGEAVAGVLSACHAAGLVHRDIKPRNVFLGTDGAVSLLDFGIVRTTPAGDLTTTSVVLGTPAYTSPEQVRGLHATPASDLYSLGCMLYEALTAEPPFGADDPDTVARAHLSADPPKPSLRASWIPPQVDGLILGLMAKDPGSRPTDAATVARAIKKLRLSLDSADNQATLYAGHTLIDAVPIAAGDTLMDAVPTDRPTRRGAGVAILLVLAMIFIGAAIWVAANHGSHPARTAGLTTKPSNSPNPTTHTTPTPTPAKVAAATPRPTTAGAAAAALLGTVQAAQGQGLIDPATASQIADATSAYLSAVASGATHEVRKSFASLTDAVNSALANLASNSPLRSTLLRQYSQLAAYAPQPGDQQN